MKNLLMRTLTAIALLPLVLFAFFRGGYFLVALMWLVAIFCAIEASNIILPKVKFAKILIPILFLGLFMPMLIYPNTVGLLAVFAVALFFFNLLILFPKNVTHETFEKMGAFFFVSFYVFVGLACLFWLQSGENLPRNTGLSFIVMACVATWLNDSFAYFAGNLFGKHPLFKRVSQNKTWEGFAGAALSTLIFASVLAYCTTLGYKTFAYITVKDIFFIVLPVIALAPLGDLFESRIKRLYQVKDTSNILPGHGGLLDRIDSLLVVLPWTALYAFIIRPLY